MDGTSAWSGLFPVDIACDLMNDWNDDAVNPGEANNSGVEDMVLRSIWRRSVSRRVVKNLLDA